MNEPTARLDEFDKTEWRDVVRRLRPDITDEEYEVLWAENAAKVAEAKRREKLH